MGGCICQNTWHTQTEEVPLSCATMQKARSPPASGPRAQRADLHAGAVCLDSVASGHPGAAVYGPAVPKAVALLYAGTADRIRRHTTMLSCELSDNESPDLESLSQRDLSRMLTAKDTVLPNKRCKRVT